MESKQDFLKSIAEECARELDIQLPPILFKIDKRTHTNRAGLILDSNKKVKCLQVDADSELLIDVVFAIAHEMRHAWQSVYASEMLDDYNEPGTLPLEAYNLQKAEVDANAYASLFCERNFGLKPLFDGFSSEVKQVIEERKKEINGWKGL